LVRIRIGEEERELTWDEWEQRVQQGRVPPDALVCIDAVTEGAFVPARSLETYQSLRNDAALAWQSRFLAGPAPILTALLVGVNIRVWWFAQVREVEDFLVVRFTNWTAPALEDGETWRTLTMGLLHTEVFHLVMNMLWLAYTGWNIERALGRLNLLTIFVASVLGGSLLSMFFAPETPSLGASGGVFGLVAASVTFGFSRPELLPARGRRVFGLAMFPYLVIMFWSGLMNEGTDNWSHFGGLLTGGALALVLDPEPLQRRPGWNRAWQSAIALLVVAILVGLRITGPLLVPEVDHVTAEERLLERRGPPRVPGISQADTYTYQSLDWDVPAGWRMGVTAAGDSGFVSPSPRGERAWAVRETRHDAPITGDALARLWLDGLVAGWPNAEVGPVAPAEVAGWPGRQVDISVDGGNLLLQWRGATRGLWSVEEVWQVDRARASRLEPLRDRLRRSVEWRDPEVLADARATVERNPASRRGRAQLAHALAEVGDVEASLELYRQLVDEDPADPDWWTGMLEVAKWYPGRVPDPDQLRDEALRTHPLPAVVIQVVESLEAAGDDNGAAGLLELAWVHFPGDRTLKRARRRRALPVDLDAHTHLPRHLVVDRDTGSPLGAEALAELRSRPLDLAEARRMGEEWAAGRAEVAARASALMKQDPILAVDPLLILRYGALPADREGAIDGLAEEMKTLEARGSLPWLPDDLAAELLASGLPALLAASPEGG